jgi:hypothetical protein
MAMTRAKTVIFSITRICAADCPFSSPDVCHDQTDPLSSRVAGGPDSFSEVGLAHSEPAG